MSAVRQRVFRRCLQGTPLHGTAAPAFGPDADPRGADVRRGATDPLSRLYPIERRQLLNVGKINDGC